MRPRTQLTAALAAATAYATMQWLGRTSGARRSEQRRLLVSDALVAHPTVVTNHALTLPAPPEQVWPWLTQTGWHRGGWYTARWVDRLLFPANWASADRLVPELVRDLAAGDTIPDGPPGTAEFVVQRAEAPYLLVLYSTTHFPASWRDRYGARLEWAWTFVLEPEGSGTRFLLRSRGRAHPWWLNASYVALIVPADFVMATSMLRGLRRRVLSARR